MEETIHTRVPQDRELPVQSAAAGPFRLRFLYARAADSREAGQPGQDYLAFRSDGHRLVFALCDGVGQSFYGDLAARFLGDALVEWLWALPGPVTGAETFRRELAAYLRSLTEAAGAQVQEVALPDDLPPMVREVLEQKRTIGSETTFVCGCLQEPTTDLPEGQLLLAWMGDSRLRLWGADGERTGELNASWDVAQRWSTRDGPKGGEVGVYVGTLAGLSSLQAYSDGLLAYEGELHPQVEDGVLDRLMLALGETATSDDISFLQIDYQPASLPLPLRKTGSFVAHLVNGRIWAAWAAVPGAEGYELNWVDRAGRERTIRVDETEWTSPLCLLGGRHVLRVRGIGGGQAGLWSQVVVVRVPWLLPHLAYAADAALALLILIVGALLSWWR